MPKTPSAKPISIKQGNFTVKIYSGTNRIGDKAYSQFSLAYYEDGRRKIRKFSSLEDAKKEARFLASKMTSSEHDVLKLSPSDRTDYVEAIKALKPSNTRLLTAVRDYVDAISRLPDGASLKETTEFYLRRHPSGCAQKTVMEIVDELLATKEQAKKSEIHLKDLKSRLTRFGKAFQMNISDVTGPMIQAYINGLKVTGRTKKNHLRHITTLFRFAARQKFLPKDSLEELEAVEMPTIEHKEITVFSPAEMSEILNAARPELIPWLCIAGFAGLRTAEIQRLEWKNVDLAEKVIEVPASKSKTASRRLAPVTDNLFAWLQPYSNMHGRVTSFENMAKQLDWLVRDINEQRKEDGQAADFKWKHNGLRHSFVSYRISQIKDVAQVALEAGNSPTVIHTNYRQLVSPSEAEKWFAISPAAEEGIIPFERAQN